MKIIAAIMDVVHVKKDGKRKQFFITKIKKCLIYDPRMVFIREIDDARSKQIR